MDPWKNEGLSAVYASAFGQAIGSPVAHICDVYEVRPTLPGKVIVSAVTSKQIITSHSFTYDIGRLTVLRRPADLM